MRLTLLTALLFVCAPIWGQSDTVVTPEPHPKSELTMDYGPAETWVYHPVIDTIQITVTRSQPALSECGLVQFSELVYGIDKNGVEVRFIVPCGQTDERAQGTVMRFVQSRPGGRISDHEFRADDPVARKYATEVIKTYWGKPVE
ncbi:MAG: hypothetical protein KDC12_02700 [Flavobacteriales bacterium]|nr:hypothetical protein [Flavobacteriales bacterium]